MDICQFEDAALSHFSYAIEDDGEVALIDPARDPAPYYDYANKRGAKIVAVIETHPHADFVSSHLEISQITGATILVSKLFGAAYAHRSFDDGNTIPIGNASLTALNTPGHSPDSISVVLEAGGIKKAVFTGDTLFIGDCGRPDLRENAGNITQKREEQARQLYHSLKRLAALPDQTVVYPAHGAGSLCGKGMSSANSSNIANEKTGNWALQPVTEKDFVDALLEGQPFIPKYFEYDVELNRRGAPSYKESVDAVPILDQEPALEHALIIDTRPASAFLAEHHKGAINIQGTKQFETWLGSLVAPGENFYLVGGNSNKVRTLIGRTARIGYEKFIAGAFVFQKGNARVDHINFEAFNKNPEDFTIIDLRNNDESKIKIFPNSIHIPLNELPERTNEIPLNKNIVVHCAGGFRSAAGASLLRRKLNGQATVYDLGDNIKIFQR